MRRSHTPDNEPGRADPSPSDPGVSPHHAPKRVKKGPIWRRRIIVTLVGVVTIAIIASVGYVVALSLRVTDNIASNAVTRPGVTATPVTIPNWDGAVNLLIMGSDTRVGQTSGSYGDKIDGARSDVMMLLHVSADHKDATLISIPRDTMLPIPSCTKADGTVVPAQDVAQINGALSEGPYCSLDAIRAFTGLDIDHFMVVSFDGVVGVTNAIGGVDVCVDHDVNDTDSGLKLTKGTHTIQGTQALAFLRTRHGFGDGSDLGRIAAQQTFLASLARKVKSAGTLTNPVALYKLADAASQAMAVDSGLASPSALVGLAGTLADIDLERIVLIQLPVTDYPPDPNRVEPIASQSKAIFAALAADKPLTLTSSSPSSKSSSASTKSSTPTSTSTPSGVTLEQGVKGQTAAVSSCAS